MSTFNAAWTIAVSRGVQLALVPACALFVTAAGTPTDAGAFSIAAVLSALVTVVADSGIHLKVLAEGAQSQRLRSGGAPLTWRSAVPPTLAVTSAIVVSWGLFGALTGLATASMLPWAFFSGYALRLRSRLLLRGSSKMDLQAAALEAGVVSGALAVALACDVPALWSGISGLTLGAAVGVARRRAALVPEDVPRKAPSSSQSPFLAWAIAGALYTRLDLLIVGVMLGVQSAGLYQAPLRFLSIGVVIVDSVGLVLLAHRYTGGLDVRSQRGKLIAAGAGLALVVVFAFAAGGAVMGWLFGEPYAEGGPVLAILLLGLPFRLLSHLGANRLSLSEGHWRRSIILWAAVLVEGVLVWALVASVGLVGAAMGAVGAEAFLATAYTEASRRASRETPEGCRP